MVNGNYVLYGDRPVSESEIVDDHVHTITAERKIKRKTHRTANELQHSLNMAQLDNETDSIKYEKRIKEPRLLRYVPTTDVEENFVSEKFETYDLKPHEERPRRYAFTKKPKNPADGSVNYAYSRSSSSCSSPNGNLPTISEHGEQYGTYRVRAIVPTTPVVHEVGAYENKLDKYFTKPREVKKFAAKGSHPDSLYRVPVDSGTGRSKAARVLRFLRWPAALILVCIALAVFVYFLMPDNMDSDAANATYWEPVAFESGALNKSTHKAAPPDLSTPKEKKKSSQTHGTRITEIDFYNTENDKNDLSSTTSTASTIPVRKLPIAPVFPSHITPEVQYGNERADTDKLRSPKILDEERTILEDSTLKPHITQKPEKPLAIYFKEGTVITSPSTETIYKAETNNDFTNYGEKYTTKKASEPLVRPHFPIYKEQGAPVTEVEYSRTSKNGPLEFVKEPELPELLEVYNRQPVKVNVDGANESRFTSGHSKLFGISIEDAEKMRSTTQSSLYNTRVSPTLPTWRDGDDTTTKKYPVNVNSDVPQCRSTRLALCRGVLPYDLAGPAATINGIEITTLLSQIEYLVATNCSDRVRHFACALLEPECNPPPYPSKIPCYNLCRAVVDTCDGLIPGELSSAFSCDQYSNKNCVSARKPCFPREFGCSDGSCVPRDWICDGTSDCPGEEDEAACALCDLNEYRCRSGGCIMKRWLCDGYADCPGGEDEAEDTCESRSPREPGEESAGSAPAPSVRRPYRMPNSQITGDLHKTGENDNSKELLVTSDSNNALRRNFTRRPSPSRLTPYSRPMLHAKPKNTPEDVTEPKKLPLQKSPTSNVNPQKAPAANNPDEEDDVKIDDIFFEDLEKVAKEQVDKKQKDRTSYQPRHYGTAPEPPVQPVLTATRINKAVVEKKNTLDRVINGAEMMRKAMQEENTPDSTEKSSTKIDKEDFSSMENPGSISAHASPCPSGELRCVDGRCITLAQLCDGTIDCTDHADEDNCYT